ncbi:MAG: PrsW family intramembrane metalloprotease [Ruminococcus sp.]|nr:PrsW family intramembrane metalloprotease [Ruminococcus sp.]
MSLLLFLALLPAAVLMVYIYLKDKVEKEPIKLLMSLFFFGGLTIVTACIIELVLAIPLKMIFDEGTFPYMLIENFLIVALAEELGKYVVLKKKTWHSPQFDYTFDAVVYAVAVSLGFAAFENVVYVLSGTIGTAIMRGLLAVPGHAIDGVFMGCYYGIARKCRGFGDEEGAKKNLIKAVIIPVLTHGFYDFCIDVTSVSSIFFLVFLAFEVAITFVALKTVKKLSSEDEAVDYYNPGDPLQ